jgi:uncharacterized protein
MRGRADLSGGSVKEIRRGLSTPHPSASRPPSPTRGEGFAAALLAFLCLLLFAPAAFAAPKFPPLTGRVVDLANVLSPESEAKLSAQSEALEAKTGHQFVVATVPDLQGYEIEDYGYQLLRTWGIGRKDKNDGVIFLVAPSERRVRIEVGYGLEPVLTDALSSVILQERVLPRFRDGQMEAGIVSGAEAVMQQLGLPEDQAKARVAEAAKVQAQPESGGASSVIVTLIVLWILFAMLRGRRGGGAWWILPLLLSGRGGGRNDGDFGGFGGGGFGGGGFSGGGGSGGGGGASGRW